MFSLFQQKKENQAKSGIETLESLVTNYLKRLGKHKLVKAGVDLVSLQKQGELIKVFIRVLKWN